MMKAKPQLIKSQDVFFPAACLAAIVLSVLSQTTRMGWTPWGHALIGLGHAHEMFFGFVLALICGYTLGKQTPVKMRLMLLLWLTARVAFVMAPGTLITALLTVLFALWVVRHIAPRYLVAKKWRNKVIAPLLVALFCFPLGWLLLSMTHWPISPQNLMQSLLVLLIMLMAFIAGRMLAPAFAGELQQQNYILHARVQPRIEALILILPPLASLLLLHPQTHRIAAVVLLLLAGLLLLRLLRWQFWRCWYRSDLMGLSLGYLWLICGCILLAYALSTGHYQPAFMHVITMGAIGTLSSMVILKYLMPKRHVPAIIFYPPVLLLIAAVLSRVAADYSSQRNAYLIAAVSAWSLAYLWVLIQWVVTKRRLNRPV